VSPGLNPPFFRGKDAATSSVARMRGKGDGGGVGGTAGQRWALGPWTAPPDPFAPGLSCNRVVVCSARHIVYDEQASMRRLSYHPGVSEIPHPTLAIPTQPRTCRAAHPGPSPRAPPPTWSWQPLNLHRAARATPHPCRPHPAPHVHGSPAHAWQSTPAWSWPRKASLPAAAEVAAHVRGCACAGP
jgi:hypothetical protein